ncbi:hypothetical protein [Streptomyces sp. WM6378]|nr:hypothetical protein [Streptomyces sp. WM6378]
MTPSTAEHPQMSVEDFEELARHARETVNITLETERLKDYAP